jgi:hypothetical protein
MPFLATMRLAGCGVAVGQLALVDLDVAEFNAASMPSPVSSFSSGGAVLLARPTSSSWLAGLVDLEVDRWRRDRQRIDDEALAERREASRRRQAAGPRWLSPSPRQLGMRYRALSG